MNEAQVRTSEQVRQVLEGTQSLEFRRAEDDQGRYAWRLVSRWDGGRRLVKDYRAPEHAFARRYTSADVVATGRILPTSTS